MQAKHSASCIFQEMEPEEKQVKQVKRYKHQEIDLPEGEVGRRVTDEDADVSFHVGVISFGIMTNYVSIIYLSNCTIKKSCHNAWKQLTAIGATDHYNGIIAVLRKLIHGFAN